MAMYKFGSAVVAEPSISQDSWYENKKLWKVECDENKCHIKTAKTIIAKYSPEKYLLSHATIIAAVETELAKSDDLKSDYYIHPAYSKFINNNGDAWSKKMIQACYRTFIGADNYLEHVQIPELSKGKVIDAFLREVPIGKDENGKDLTTFYVDILVATDRKHKDLVKKIESKEVDKMSMGCIVAFTICTKCGNIAKDDTETCEHVKYEKNNIFYDEYGTQRKIAELCGHYDQPDSVVFKDASWVANPAFTGAVVRNVVNPPENIMAKIESANKKESYEYKEGDLLRVATYKKSQGENVPEKETPAEESVSEDEPAETHEEEFPTEKPTLESAPEESQNSVKLWKKRIKERLLQELGDEMVQEFEENEPSVDQDLESLDDTLIQPTASQALKQMYKMKKSWDKYLHKFSQNLNKKNFDKLKFGTYMVLTGSDLTSLVDYGYNKRDFLAVMSFIDNCFKKPLSIKIKKAIAELGGTQSLNYNDAVFALQKLAGTRLSDVELKRSLTWLKLLDSYPN
ncbi:hypothetical protein DRQ07_03985 [candidate division KSB1 bacterium]|nr:MAG: hypothetical protein DRQ07_03985 [candidate division KSB1 bacterium]